MKRNRKRGTSKGNQCGQGAVKRESLKGGDLYFLSTSFNVCQVSEDVSQNLCHVPRVSELSKFVMRRDLEDLS